MVYTLFYQNVGLVLPLFQETYENLVLNGHMSLYLRRLVQQKGFSALLTLARSHHIQHQLLKMVFSCLRKRMVMLQRSVAVRRRQITLNRSQIFLHHRWITICQGRLKGGLVTPLLSLKGSLLGNGLEVWSNNVKWKRSC